MRLVIGIVVKAPGNSLEHHELDAYVRHSGLRPLGYSDWLFLTVGLATFGKPRSRLSRWRHRSCRSREFSVKHPIYPSKMIKNDTIITSDNDRARYIALRVCSFGNICQACRASNRQKWRHFHVIQVTTQRTQAGSAWAETKLCIVLSLKPKNQTPLYKEDKEDNEQATHRYKSKVKVWDSTTSCSDLYNELQRIGWVSPLVVWPNAFGSVTDQWFLCCSAGYR